MNTIGHAEFEDRVAAYLTGGLDAPQRAEMEAHAATCASCAAALRDATTVDRDLVELFEGIQPEAGFEDRIVKRLREEGRLSSLRLRIHPAIGKAVSGLAAALVIGACGYAATELIETGKLPQISFGDIASSPRSNSSVHTEPPADFITDLKAGGESAPRDYYRYRGDEFPAEKARKEAENVWRRTLKRIEDQERSTEALGNKRFDDQVRQLGEPEALGVVINSPKAAEPIQQKMAGLDGATAASTTTMHFDFTPPSQPLNTELFKTPAEGKGVMRGWGVSAGGGGGGQLGLTNGTVAFGQPTDEKPADGTVALGSIVTTEAVDAAGKPVADDKSYYAKLTPAQPPQTAYFLPLAPGAADKELKELVKEEAEVMKVDATVGRLTAGGTTGLAGSSTRVPASIELLTQRQDAQAPNATPPPVVNQQPPQNAVVQQAPQMARKIIRNGEMEFEVESFDSSFVQIAKIVAEEGGFVSSTNSEKLPNGKVKGTIVVRVPPERLDTLVLKLRALGDLRSQRISAQDVSKVYNDLESELKAGRAMEERLLNIIKSGKGEIKDLLEAEKQLGTYRSKIEKLEGEIRYYNNLVSLSTLSVTAFEKDIKTPAFAAQSETVGMGIETDAVDKARADALKAIDEAKGRIIESNLKQHDAGQLSATIVAEVSPDAGGPLTDRLKQLGRVARLDVERKQSTPTGVSAPAPTRVEKKDTRFQISIYNLANVAPRQTTNTSLAVANVEETYKSILALVQGKTGRIVSSTLNRQKPEQTTANISFEVPSAEADATLTELRRDREVLNLTVTENPDTNNVTTAKRGFSIQIQSMATVPPRETEQLVLTSRTNVAEAYNRLVAEARKADARILVSHLNEQDKSNVTAALDIEVLRTKEVDFRAALLAASDTISRAVARASEAENTVDSKVRIQMRLMSLDRLTPRETQTLGLAVKDVPAAYQSLLSSLQEVGARIITSNLNEQDKGNITGTLEFEVPRERRGTLDKMLALAGIIHARSVARASDTQNTVESKLRMQASLSNIAQLPPREKTQLMLEVRDVDKHTSDILVASSAAGGRTIQSTQSKTDDGRMTSHIIVDLPLPEAAALREQINRMGEVRFKESSTDPQAPEGQAARAQLDVTLASPDVLVGRDEGLGATLRNALSTSLKGLLWSLNLIVMGLVVIVPWALLLWAGFRLLRKARAKPAT